MASDQLKSGAVDAGISIKDGQIVETESKDGTMIDLTNLENQIENILNGESASNILILNTIAVKPNITTANFTTAKLTASAYLEKIIVLQFEDKTYKPSRTEIGNWIDFGNNNGQIFASINDSKIKTYLAKANKDIAIPAKERKINGSDGSILDPGQDGRTLDTTKALGDIKNALSRNTSTNITLAAVALPASELKVFPAEGLVLNRFQGKYLDIDLAAQRLCRIETDQLIDCFIISSGKASMPTPTGTYNITSKSPRQYSYEYKMWMPWWEQFNGDYGIHELPETDTWKEVPDHLGTPVSHGCIRLGVGPAQAVFDWTDIGTTVYIHK